MPTLADVLNQYGDEYLRRYGDRMPRQHHRVIGLLRACGSGQLGHAEWYCEHCRTRHFTPRSCGNRHCPGCHAGKNADWLEAQRKKLLPVPYFLITFTLPAPLRGFVRSHPGESYKALFRAAWESLQKLAADPRFCGAAKIGCTAVLHSWGRDLSFHPHLHCIVSGGGMSADDRRWCPSRKDFFVRVEPLSMIFRAKFRDALRAEAIEHLVPLHVWRENFVTDSQPVGNGEHCLGYLANYVSRTAISNHRILSCDDGTVRFLWKKSGTREWQVMQTDAMEFIRRFLQHVLPAGFQRIRHFGLLNEHSRVGVSEAREAIAETAADDEQPAHNRSGDSLADEPSLDASQGEDCSDEPSSDNRRRPLCPECGGRLVLVDITFRRDPLGRDDGLVFSQLSYQDSG